MLTLRELRAIAGMTLAQLGEPLGLQDEEVQDLERSELRSLTVNQVVRYCDGLGMPLTISVDVHSRPKGTVEILSTRKRCPQCRSRNVQPGEVTGGTWSCGDCGAVFRKHGT